jgi:hypothetical protein
MSNKSTYLHLDSIGLPYSTNPKQNSYTIIPGNTQFAPSSFNMVFKLRQPIYSCKKIYLKSFECPLLFPNIRATSDTNFISLNLSGTVKKITIPDFAYNGIDKLLTDLTSYANSQYPLDGITFSLSTSLNSGNVKIVSTANSVVNVVQTSGNLAYVLGFRNGLNTTINNTIFAAYRYNLSFDQYMHMYVSQLGNSNAMTNTGILSSFKILLTQNNESLQFVTEGSGSQQFITISSPQTPIDSLEISFTDRFNRNLSSFGADYSCSLLFTTE